MQQPLDLARYGIDSLWLNDAPADRRLLVAYAHPDDESFGSAGTLARYAAEGVAVHLVCATRGECGMVSAAQLEGYADLAALRSTELGCAARTLGLAAVHFLGYRDSGMAGAAENDHPQAFAHASAEQVTARVTTLIRALRPQVVVTFGPYGGYGHPDHIAIHTAARQAFAAAGDQAYSNDLLVEGLAPWQPAKLYYSTISTRVLRLSVRMMRLFGRDPRRIGENGDIDLLRVIEETTPATTVIDNRAYLTEIEQAWRCHATQLPSVERALHLPRPLRRRVLGVERFTRVVPAWPGGAREHDLFAQT